MIDQIWWYLSRATGIVAWALLAASVLWGLLLSTSLLKGWSKPKWLLDLHRFLGGAALCFTAIHMASLVADSFVTFTPVDLLVPGASAWKTWPVAAGVLAFYTLVAVEVSSLAMRRLPRRLWRAIHLTSFACYWAATIHLITAGTDATSPWLWWTSSIVSTLVVFLTLYRILADAEARRPARPARRQPATAR